MSNATHTHDYAHGHGHVEAHDQPGLQIVDPDFFNQMTTMHGPIMVFHAIMPTLVCFVYIAYEILSNQPGPPLWP